MNSDFISALGEIERSKGIDKEYLIEAIEAALVFAYKKNLSVNVSNISASLDPDTCAFKVFAEKTVVKEVNDHYSEIIKSEAVKIDPKVKLEDTIFVDVTPDSFGRIAAQTAKQVVSQKIRDAERSILLSEFANKEDDIVSGIVKKTDRRHIVVDLGKEVEGYIEQKEQVPNERFSPNEHLKCYVIDVKDDPKGPKVMLSRTHPGLVKRLFELEVPEIYSGLVEIKSVSREPGARTKIAVYSNEPNVDPVGACVGQRGTRVQAVVDELFGEKIDIIQWSDSPEIFISNSLSPAEVLRVDITGEYSARIMVPDHQLSLAIGKEGQNVRLAARLTSWKIDIKSESQFREVIEQELLDFEGGFFNNDYDMVEGEDVGSENFDGADTAGDAEIFPENEDVSEGENFLNEEDVPEDENFPDEEEIPEEED